MRYAHSEGHTNVTYDSSGRYIITCGNDGDIHIFDGFEDDDPQTHHLGTIIHTLGYKNNLLYLGTDNQVQSYTFPEIVCDSTILQFFTPVFHVSCSNSGRYIAAGGGDFMIKVYDSELKKFSTCGIHEAPILSLSFDPQETYLASSSCDGTVRITQLPDFTCVKVMNLIKKSNDFCNSETLCRLHWHPNKGKFLVIPVEMRLQFYERSSWTCLFTYQDENISQILSLAVFSPCGNFVAAASNEGKILVWDMNTKKCIGKMEHSKQIKICDLAWNPSSKKELAFTDVEGQLGVFDEFPSVNVNNKMDSQITAKMPSPMFSAASGDKYAHEDDMELGDENESNGLDIGALRAKWEPKIFGMAAKEDTPVADVQTPTVERQAEIPATPIQVSFQPGSTPLHLDNRFMVWNSVGIVKCYNSEEENSVEVEFHDVSVYHPFHVNNIHNFTMASLSTEALLLASTKSDDGFSKLQCQRFDKWDSNKEWIVTMDENEEIEAITLGSGWAAVVTNLRFLRLFTVSGIQCEIICLPGPVVCLAASETQLAVAYHQGLGLAGEQNLGIMYVNVNIRKRCTCRYHPLPLSAKSFLSWMGFSDLGQLCTVDTSGNVQLLCSSGISKWTPIANTKSLVKGKSDHFFIVSVSELEQQLSGIVCKGARYPSLLPRPIVTALAFSMPFTEMNRDKSCLEETKEKLSIVYHQLKSHMPRHSNVATELLAVENKLSVVLMKEFALALQSGQEYRALDICKCMPNSQAIEGAIRYATSKRHMVVAEHLGEFLHKRTLNEALGDEIEPHQEEEEEPLTPVPAHLKNKIKIDESQVLRPKALSFRRRNSSKKEAQEEQPSIIEHKNDGMKTVIIKSKSSPAINPFKVKPQDKNESPSTNKIDESTPNLTSKANSNGYSEKKTARQTKLFEKEKNTSMEEADTSPSVPKKFGFALFLEEQKEQLKVENPDVEDHEITKLAMKLFRSLSDEEKEKYNRKRIIATPEEQDRKRAKTNDEPNSSDSASLFKKFSFTKTAA